MRPALTPGARWGITLIALGAWACESTPDPRVRDAPGADATGSGARPAIATPPFTAAQIQSATRVGRSYEMRIESPDHPTTLRRMTFTEVRPDGCTIEGQNIGEDGVPRGAPTVSHATWEELVGHASYPADATTRGEATIETPAGSFDCVTYTVNETGEAGEAQITHAFFAKSLPGAPVRLVVERDGAVVSRMEMVSYIEIGP